MKKQKGKARPPRPKKRTKRPAPAAAPSPRAHPQNSPSLSPLDHFTGPDTFALVEQARAALTRGDWRRARDLGRLALMAASDDADALNVTGIAAFHLGDRAEALTLFDTALAFHPGHGEALMNRGNVLADMGQLDAAEEAYNQAVAALPGNSGARFNRAVLREVSGRFAEAEADFRQILAHDPGEAEARFHLANIMKALNRLSEAVAEYDQVLKDEPGHVGAATNRGAALQESGKPLEARAAYEQALSLEPNHPDARYNLATLLQESGHSAEALPHYQAVMATRPDHAGAQVNIAYALRELGRMDEALDAARETVRLAPDYDKARVNLADQLLVMGHGAEAVAEISAFLDDHPGNTSALAFQAIALTETGDREGAARLLDFETLLRPTEIAAPEGYADVAAFNRALARHLRKHPSLAYAPASHATRKGRHSGELLIGETGPIAGLEQVIRDVAEAYRADVAGALPPDHPFLARIPARTRLSIWGVVMEDQGQQIAHIHPAAWLSGVYYPEIPDVVRDDDPAHQGWIEFGRPPKDFHCTAEPLVRLIRPREGLMLLFPSYLYHETIPFHATVERLSIAFDIMPADG